MISFISGVLAQPRTEPELFDEPPDIPNMNFNREVDGPDTAPQRQPVDEIDARPIVAQQQEEVDPGFFDSGVEDYPEGAALPQVTLEPKLMTLFHFYFSFLRKFLV